MYWDERGVDFNIRRTFEVLVICVTCIVMREVVNFKIRRLENHWGFSDLCGMYQDERGVTLRY